MGQSMVEQPARGQPLASGPDLGFPVRALSGPLVVLILCAAGAAPHSPGMVDPVAPPGDVGATPRWAHVAVVVDEKIYVLGGVDADNQPVAGVEVYDPASGTWVARADMPSPRALLGACALGGKIYAIGGTTMGLDKLGVVEVYDPEADRWSRKADLPTARSSLAAVAVNGRIYAIGGAGLDPPPEGWESADLENATAFSTVEIYEPETDSWRSGPAMPTARATLTASAVGGRIYAIGGATRREGRDVALSLVEVFDTETRRWMGGAEMPTARFVPSSAVVDGRVYVTGGAVTVGPTSTQEERMRGRVPLSVVEVFDPASGRWVGLSDLAVPRGWHSASAVSGRLYLIGGRSLAPKGGIVEVEGAIPDVEVYSPRGDLGSTLRMKSARRSEYPWFGHLRRKR